MLPFSYCLSTPPPSDYHSGHCSSHYITAQTSHNLRPGTSARVMTRRNLPMLLLTQGQVRNKKMRKMRKTWSTPSEMGPATALTQYTMRLTVPCSGQFASALPCSSSLARYVTLMPWSSCPLNIPSPPHPPLLPTPPLWPHSAAPSPGLCCKVRTSWSGQTMLYRIALHSTHHELESLANHMLG